MNFKKEFHFKKEWSISISKNKQIRKRKLTLQKTASTEIKLKLQRLRVHLIILKSILYDYCSNNIPFMSINLFFLKIFIIYNIGVGVLQKEKRTWCWVDREGVWIWEKLWDRDEYDQIMLLKKFYITKRKELIVIFRTLLLGASEILYCFYVVF